MKWNPSRGTCHRGIFSAFREHQSGFCVPILAFWGMRRNIAAFKQRRMAWPTALKRKDALRGDRRRANKEADLPLVGNDDRFGLRRGGSQLHDHNHSRSGGNWHHRVHDDAQLAVIRVGLVRVQVCNLRHRQHRQQDQAKHGNRRHKAGPRAAFPEPL
jgi:hypothetical protein